MKVCHWEAGRFGWVGFGGSSRNRSSVCLLYIYMKIKIRMTFEGGERTNSTMHKILAGFQKELKKWFDFDNLIRSENQIQFENSVKRDLLIFPTPDGTG